ncbi:MAG: hypothetical protein IH946_04440 [Bacteroidetes bacterium]|nr:hypothetical protein [Bacteroidota bacterium]
MSTKLKIQLRKLGIITFIWILMGAFLAVYDHLILISSYSTGTDHTVHIPSELYH